MKKIVVLISGGGSNLEAIAKACQTGNIPASIELVISNQSNVKGLERAQKFHLISRVIQHQDFNSREEFDKALLEQILPIEPDLVVLAGFMRILSKVFTNSKRTPEYPKLKDLIFNNKISLTITSGIGLPVPQACERIKFFCNTLMLSVLIFVLHNEPNPVFTPYTKSLSSNIFFDK